MGNNFIKTKRRCKMLLKEANYKFKWVKFYYKPTKKNVEMLKKKKWKIYYYNKKKKEFVPL